ncbi:MAG: histidine phosphotransferase family protein [Pseudomonadota bacterium]
MAEELAPAPADDHGKAAISGGDAALVSLGGLVAARICHDLVGPVGAIANGIDLMAETQGGDEAEEVGLVRQSTERASALLRILRIAFGEATRGGPAVARGDVTGQLRDVIASRRVSFSVVGEDGPPLDPAAARLAALMVLSGRVLLGLSGQIELVLSPESALPIRVTAEGSRAAFPPRAEAWLSGRLGDLPASREVELALLPRVATAAGARLDWQGEDARVTLCACPQ